MIETIRDVSGQQWKAGCLPRTTKVGDGTVRRFTTGDILLAEDTTGQGHISRAVNGKPRKSLFIALD